ncbi:MAG: TlpA family protein disulfide reductase [Panacagrimonas sp.]
MRMLPVLPLLLATLLAAFHCQSVRAIEPTPAKRLQLIAFGSVAPEIAGLILNGKAGTKLSDYRGKVVAVDFWATWCTPCLQSMPELNRMRGQIAEMGFGDRFEIIGVNVDDDIPKARRFLEVNPVSYPVIGDPIGIAMSRYGPWKLPATFLLTPEGKVHMIWLGYAENFSDDIRDMAVGLLRQLGPPHPPVASP